MATAQMPGRSRLADDAATAALYVTHPDRNASIRAPTAPNNRYYNTPDLSHASAASALAHANRKPVEIWHPPARLPAAEKAALCVKDYTPPQQPKPTTQYSSEGLGAALLAIRDQNKASAKAPQSTHKRGLSADQYRNTYVGGDPKEKALQAATGAYTTSRKRADSVPSDKGVSSEQPYALSAAGASQHVRPEPDAPLNHLDNAAEASRIHNIATANAKLYTSAPPIQAEIEEQNYKNSLRAASISMAKDMYKVTEAKESAPSNPALQAAQKGQNQLGYRKTVLTADGDAIRRAIALQDAAQKRAAEKLALMHDENAEYQQYYGTAPQPQRSRLSRRKRTSSDADASQIDAEQSRQIRSQMFSLRTKLNQVDARTRDRELLMQAARRNVDQTLQDMEARVYADTGRAPPAVQRGWDEVAQERVRREAESLEEPTTQGDRVKIGSQQYMDYADVEAVARSRVQPALDEITANAEQQRAHEVEVRLDAEERERHAAVEREREAELRELEKQDKSTNKHKSAGKVTIPKFFLWRKKGKRARVEQSETEDAQAVSPITQEPAEEHAQVAAPDNDVSKDVIPEEHSSDPEVAGAAAPIAVAPAAVPAAAATAVSEPNEEPTRVPTEEIQEAAQEPTDESIDESIDDIPPAIPRRQSAPQTRDAASTGPTTVHYFTPPVSSPRADSKLKTWFRDRLVRRSSGPVPVYPHQPGPDFTDSEPAFQGGAALTGRDEPRSTALSSHPFNGSDSIPTHNRSSSYYSNEVDVTKTRSGESNSESLKNANGTETYTGKKRNRLRRTFLKSVSRSDDDPMNGTGGGDGTGNADERRDSGVPSSHSKGTDIQSLRDSALEQGLPAPPTLGESASTKRESRFSEDL